MNNLRNEYRIKILNFINENKEEVKFYYDFYDEDEFFTEIEFKQARLECVRRFVCNSVDVDLEKLFTYQDREATRGACGYDVVELNKRFNKIFLEICQ